MPRNKTAAALGFCDHCDKLSYDVRSDAHTVAKQHHPHKQAYPCPLNDADYAAAHGLPANFFTLFHVGALPRAIRQGHVTRGEYFGEEAG